MDGILAFLLFFLVILAFGGLGYIFYRLLNKLLTNQLVLRIAGVILLLSVIAIYFGISGVCIKDIYLMIVSPQATNQLYLKSFLLAIFYVIFFSELSLKSLTGKSLIQAVNHHEKWCYPLVILFFLFLIIGITYTMTMMLGTFYYFKEQSHLQFANSWFLVNSCGLSLYTFFTIRKLSLFKR